MKYIAHRINTVSELQKLPPEYGVELDLRPWGTDKIILEHNPFTRGESFEEYLKHYRHGTMILNIKSERIEFKVLELLKKYDLRDYFFLDSSFPMIIALTNQGTRDIALRFSEFEGMDTIKIMKDRVNWIWVDCFTQIPLDTSIFNTLKGMGFKLCFVSPELQSRPENIDDYAKQLKDNQIFFDSICTKHYNIKTWKKYFD